MQILLDWGGCQLDAAAVDYCSGGVATVPVGWDAINPKITMAFAFVCNGGLFGSWLADREVNKEAKKEGYTLPANRELCWHGVCWLLVLCCAAAPSPKRCSCRCTH